MDKLTALTTHGPKYYTNFAIQPAEFSIKNRIPFAEGCVIKYVCRWREKGGIEDLRKAKHYIDMLIVEENSNEC